MVGQSKHCAILTHKISFSGMIPNILHRLWEYFYLILRAIPHETKLSRNAKTQYRRPEISTTWKFANYFATYSMPNSSPKRNHSWFLAKLRQYITTAYIWRKSQSWHIVLRYGYMEAFMKRHEVAGLCCLWPWSLKYHEKGRDRKTLWLRCML